MRGGQHLNHAQVDRDFRARWVRIIAKRSNPRPLVLCYSNPPWEKKEVALRALGCHRARRLRSTKSFALIRGSIHHLDRIPDYFDCVASAVRFGELQPAAMLWIKGYIVLAAAFPGRCHKPKGESGLVCRPILQVIAIGVRRFPIRQPHHKIHLGVSLFGGAIWLTAALPPKNFGHFAALAELFHIWK